uniref:Nicotinamide riboside kinase 1 n=1 Tax=Takifugu rubripes TaxID=31033 RepID=A0A674PEN7_TAKRU
MSRNCVARASEIKKLIVGIGGMTNGGKSTLSQSLHQQIPNSCVIAQDSYFKVEVFLSRKSCQGFLALLLKNSKLYLFTRMSQRCQRTAMDLSNMIVRPSDEQLFVLIVEGFLIFNYRPLNLLFDKRYFMEIPYDVCKRRRSLRVYTPPDPPGYFDGHVWPMYLKNRIEMEDSTPGIVFLDGQKPKEELLSGVHEKDQDMFLNCFMSN